MSGGPFRVAVVGLGYWGPNLLRNLVELDCAEVVSVPLIDSTAAHSLVAFVNKLNRSGTTVMFAAARPQVRRILSRAGLKPPLVRYAATSRDVSAE